MLLVTLMGGVVGCGRPPHLAGGPIELSERPATVRFVQPASGPTWELCFEFDLPRDSHRAASIQATLISRSGSRDPMRSPTLDRRGESIVCQIGNVSSPPSGSEEQLYESVELHSDVPLQLRGIGGGPVR